MQGSVPFLWEVGSTQLSSEHNGELGVLVVRRLGGGGVGFKPVVTGQLPLSLCLR